MNRVILMSIAMICSPKMMQIQLVQSLTVKNSHRQHLTEFHPSMTILSSGLRCTQQQCCVPPSYPPSSPLLPSHMINITYFYP